MGEIAELKDLIIRLKDVTDKRKEYEELETNLRTLVLNMLTENELENFKVPGIAYVSRTKKLSFKLPERGDGRAQFQKWFIENYGKDAFNNEFCLSSQTFNAFLTREAELSKERGDVVFKIPGVNDPMEYETLSLRKA